MFLKDYVQLQVSNINLIQQYKKLEFELQSITNSRLFRFLKLIRKIFHFITFWNWRMNNILNLSNSTYRSSHEKFIFYILNDTQPNIKDFKKNVYKQSNNFLIRLGISFFTNKRYLFVIIKDENDIKNNLKIVSKNKFSKSRVILVNNNVIIKIGVLNYLENHFQKFDSDLIFSDLQFRYFELGSPQSVIMPLDPRYLLENLDSSFGFIALKNLDVLKNLQINPQNNTHNCNNELIHNIFIAVKNLNFRITKADECLIYTENKRSITINKLCNLQIFKDNEIEITYPVMNKIKSLPKLNRVEIIVPTRGEYFDSNISIDFEQVIKKNLSIINAESNLTNIEFKVSFVIGPEFTLNGSKALHELEKLFKFSIIESKDTFNFSQRLNLVLQNSESDYFLLLNDDILLNKNGFIVPMLSHFIEDNAGAVGARLVYPTGLIQHAGVTVTNSVVDHYLRGYPITNPHVGHVLIREVSAVTAAMCLISKKATSEVGFFDEHFPIEFGDIDYMLKLNSRNYKIIYDPRITAVHYESLTRGSDTKIEDFIKLNAKWQLPIADPFYIDPA